MQTESIQYSDKANHFHGHLAFKQSDAKLPGIIVIHDWTGLNDHAKERAEWLAEAGFVGFAIDMYGEGKTGNNNDEKLKLIEPFIADRNLVIDRIKAAMEFLKTHEKVDANQLFITGFCFGGMAALDAARAGLAFKAAVSFHGNLAPANFSTKTPIKTKILGLHGYNDPHIPPKNVNEFQAEMTEAKADWEFVSYSDTVHAFTNKLANDPVFGAVYSERADKRSWQACLEFLKNQV